MLLENIDNQKNEKKQQGNRRYSILLLALLFIGMATYGTYAYFTDSTSVDGNIKLSTGTVSFGEVAAKDWEYQGNGNAKINKATSEFNFSNVQPGDSFVKTATVTYTGTLDGIVQVNQFTDKDLAKNLDYKILIDGSEVDSTKKMTVQNGEKFEVTLTATLPLGVEESYKGKEENRNNQTDKVINLDGLAEAITFSVQQTGAVAQP